MPRFLASCCLLVTALAVVGCGPDAGSGTPATAETAAAARSVGVAPSFTGTWTGTARPAPVIRAGLAAPGSPMALVLPLPSLFAGSEGDAPDLPPFTWTIISQADAAGGVTGIYSDDAGRCGALSGTVDAGGVEFVVSGTTPGGAFVLRCSGTLSQPAEFAVTQMSLAEEGASARALTSSARLVAVPAIVAPAILVREDAVLIEEDILDP